MKNCINGVIVKIKKNEKKNNKILKFVGKRNLKIGKINM